MVDCFKKDRTGGKESLLSSRHGGRLPRIPSAQGSISGAAGDRAGAANVEVKAGVFAEQSAAQGAVKRVIGNATRH